MFNMVVVVDDNHVEEEIPYSVVDDFALCRFYEDRDDSFEKTTASFYDPHRLPNYYKRIRHGNDPIINAVFETKKEDIDDFPPYKKFKHDDNNTFG